MDMGSENQSQARPGELESGRKSCVSGDSSNIKPDSFVVEMDRFVDKDNINGNSRITLQRNLSRKGSGKCGEKKINSILGANERDACMPSSSPRALHGSSTPEKPTMVVAAGATDNSTTHQPHHQITINGSLSNAAAESKGGNKRFSFRRSPPSFTLVDPRRILFLFATMSSIGTVILIYFTLSMTMINGDDNALN